ncbi:MAG: FeoA family protein [Sulfurimonas sp.]|nr:FeoA family protein [Sulfurimonas sp.]
MPLSEIAIGRIVAVIDIQEERILKKRLMSLGIIKHSYIKVLEENIGRKNIKISLGSTEIALRNSEAQKIIVEEVA